MPGPLVVQIAQASRRIPLAMPMLNKFARDNPSAVIMSASYPYGGIGALAQSVAGGLRLITKYSFGGNPWFGIYKKMTPGVIEQWVWGIGASGNHLLYWPAFSESVFEGVLQFRANPSEGEGSGVGHYDASFAFRGLEQETDYFLVVRAQASGQDARGRPHGFTEYAWAFRTGRRDVTVTPGRLHVDLDGDPLSSGEMEFTLAMYDGPTGERFSASRYPGSGSVSLGDGAEVPAPFPAAARTKVGSSIVLSLWGMDDDSGLSIDLAGTGMHERHPGRGAAWEQRDGIETSTRNSAWVDREVLLTDSPGRHEQSFDLYTGGFTTIQYRLAMTVAHEVVRPTRRPKLVLKRYPYPDGWPNDVCPLGLEPLIP